jgi:hypothetical protein
MTDTPSDMIGPAILEARPKTPFLLRLEIWRHLRG